jgi:hypothetical protein
MFTRIGRGLLLAVFAFLLLPQFASAAPAAPTLEETPWLTGELQICWSGVTSGNTIILYTKTYRDSSYVAMDSWVAGGSTGCYIVKPFENGQTVWHYIVQIDPMDANNPSPASNLGKQTPPITAYIVNWPDMFNDLKGALQDLGNSINNHMDQLWTPSPQAISGLETAIDGLKDAAGAGAAQQAGNDLSGGLSGALPGMKAPIVSDDGQGTYTGGSGGLTLPNTKSPDSLGLIVPNVDEGTDTELTMRIPYMVDMQGQLLYIKLFTKEQMDKMKWLGLLRKLAGAALWILFGFWFVTRFTPQMKV